MSEQLNKQSCGIRQAARPIAMLLLVFALCALAVGEACGYSAPTWFSTFAMSVVGEWVIERAVRKSKGEA
jgi:hypothetical protein